MIPFNLLVTAALLSAAVPARAAFVLGPQTCNNPDPDGRGLLFSHRSYLSRNARLAREAQKRFSLDAKSALEYLQQRHPSLELTALRIRVIRCTVYFEAESGAKSYLFDAQTYHHINKEHL